VRGLAAEPSPDSAGLEVLVGRRLERRLLPGSPRPLAVALSGGGDSLALALIAAGWARGAGRRLLVLSVDHRLRPESARWTADCAAVAGRIGAEFRALAWEGEKPVSGLQAAARAARHRLLADAARTAGAHVLLIGHTADDVAEAQRMRANGSSTPDPREWSPSPAWPQGRGLFLLRPMLSVPRADLRAWLAARGEAWIDDPANDDLRFARARARRSDDAGAAASQTAEAGPLARLAVATLEGGLTISRPALRAADPDAARRFVGAACLSAAGAERPAAGERVRRLAERLAGAEEGFVATLAGARIEAGRDAVRFQREAGEAARGGLQPLRLAPGETGVWDGRFEIAADRALDVRRLAGLVRRLPPSQQAALLALPPAARGGLPAIVAPDGSVGCPLLSEVPGIRAAPLAHARLLAACGAIEREPA
jgi:tRNA(Ile)-lysidine synthase